MKRVICNVATLVWFAILMASCVGTKVTYSNLSVPEEGGVKFTRLTYDEDMVVGPYVSQDIFRKGNLRWWSAPMLAVSPDGTKFAYISRKNGMDNIMIRNVDKIGTSVQRTFRRKVMDMNWSPDGKHIVFSESDGNRNTIYMIGAESGSTMQQISNSTSNDNGPIWSNDGKKIFFTRTDSYSNSIWAFDIKDNQFTQYSAGFNPNVVKGNPNLIICTRSDVATNRGEIWCVDVEKGIETLILSDVKKSYSSPQLSPDGRWIVCVGNTTRDNRQNLDLYAVKIDGTTLTQLTFHPGNDASPVWSVDGKEILFLSQRGTEKPNPYNVWKMNFDL